MNYNELIKFYEGAIKGLKEMLAKDTLSEQKKWELGLQKQIDQYQAELDRIKQDR